MKKYGKLIVGATLMFFFTLLTILLLCVDVKPIGPNGTNVGLATLNQKMASNLHWNETLFKISDVLEYFSIAVAAVFVVVGLVQWIKRKNILKVDHQVLTLGVCYAIVISAYIFFELVKINYRPNGTPEASYPSSHTMTALFVFISAIVMAKYLLKDYKALRITSYVVLIALSVTTVGLRILSGAHWFTDILGGCLFAAGLFYLFLFFIGFIQNKKDASAGQVKEK